MSHDLTSVTVSDHVRPTSGNHPPGVYRVVGTGVSITLLRVTDEQGRRRATGDLRSVPRETLEFESATDPDAGIHPLRWTRGLLSGTYWELRSVVKWVFSY